MSSPILYKANETNFNHLGLGVLIDAVSCLVTEERNGLFELEMEYPTSGAQFNELKSDRLLKVDAGHNSKDQRFKIIRITKPMNGLVTIYAEHVSYLAQDLALKPDVEYNGPATQALTAWANSFVDNHPFTTYSNILTTGSGKWTIDKVDNARKALGGVAGSLLDTYGGEYKFDNYHVMLYEQRGSDNGALIAYGRNLSELTEEELIDSTYTSIYPYAIYTDGNEEEQLITLPEYFLDSQYAGNFARRKLLKVDFSEDEITTVEALRSRAESYLTANNVGVPKVNLEIEFVDLARTLDHDNMKILEEINLCDIVTVYFEKFDIQTKAKVIKVTWNALLDEYESIEVGEARTTLSRSIDATIDGKLETVTRRINSVQIAANGKNRVYRGPEEPENGVKNDLWYKPVGDGEIEMYIHNGSVWHLEKYSGDQVAGTINFANVNGINFNASNIVTGTLEGLLIVGSQFFSFAEDSENYVRIQSDNINSHGIFTRTWGGITDTARLNLGISRGRLLFSNEDTGQNLYGTELGFSTTMAGATPGVSAGTLEFHSQRFNATSRGVTLHSTYGTVALLSDFSSVISRSALTNNIESEQFSVYVRPYMNTRGGVNEFQFYVKDNPAAGDTDGALLYGNLTAGATHGSGIRFSKQSSNPTIYSTNNAGDIGTGDFNGRFFYGTDFVGALKAPSTNLYAMTAYDGEFRVTDKMGYNGGSMNFRPVIALDFRPQSTERIKTNIFPWEESVLDQITDYLKLYAYNMKQEVGTSEERIRHGVIIEREVMPNMVVGSSVDLYEYATWAMKGLQEAGLKIRVLEEKMKLLESA